MPNKWLAAVALVDLLDLERAFDILAFERWHLALLATGYEARGDRGSAALARGIRGWAMAHPAEVGDIRWQAELEREQYRTDTAWEVFKLRPEFRRLRTAQAGQPPSVV